MQTTPTVHANEIVGTKLLREMDADDADDADAGTSKSQRERE